MKSSAALLLFFAIVFPGLFAIGQQPTLFQGMSHPESVAGDQEFLYVTDIGAALNPVSKDGDGKIWRLTKDGKFIDSNFFKATLNAPKGTALFNEKLYVADIDRIVVFDTKTGTMIKDFQLASIGVMLVNDLCIKNGQELFATCTILGKVIRISLKDDAEISFLNIPVIKGANGISYHKETNRLAVVGLGSFETTKGIGEVFIIKLNGQQAISKKVDGLTGFFDGVEWLDSARIIVDDWVSLSESKGNLGIINLKTREYRHISHSPIGGSADFYFDRERHQLIVPATLEGKIIQLQLGSILPSER